MLKKDIEKQLAGANVLIENYRASSAVDKDMLKSANVEAAKHRKLRKHTESALVAISAIMEVNCRDIIESNRFRFEVLQQAESRGEEPPEFPPISELYSVLCHIQSILLRSVEEPKEDSRFGRF